MRMRAASSQHLAWRLFSKLALGGACIALPWTVFATVPSVGAFWGITLGVPLWFALVILSSLTGKLLQPLAHRRGYTAPDFLIRLGAELALTLVVAAAAWKLSRPQAVFERYFGLPAPIGIRATAVHGWVGVGGALWVAELRGTESGMRQLLDVGRFVPESRANWGTELRRISNLVGSRLDAEGSIEVWADTNHTSVVRRVFLQHGGGCCYFVYQSR